MSEQVKRYVTTCDCTSEAAWGDYVRHSDYDALHAENARLREQVKALQSDANSWQAGYGKGREDGAKAAEGWKGQHARDSAELRRLCAERDALRAELAALKAPAVAGNERVESYLSALEQFECEGETFLRLYDVRDLIAELKARPAQTEQQPVALQHVAYAEDGALHWMTGRKVGCCELYAMPDFGRAPELYAAPIAQTEQQPVYGHIDQFGELASSAINFSTPSPQVQRADGLAEALEECAASLAWNCFGECRAIHAGPIMPAAQALEAARAALAAHRAGQAQSQRGGGDE